MILIIEDQPLHAKFFQEVFRAFGEQSVTALTGQEGLSIAAAISPALVVVDILLPGVNGQDVIASLRRCAVNGGVAIIAVTAAAGREIEDECLAAGADVFLRKPVLIEQLNAAFAEVRDKSSSCGKRATRNVAGATALSRNP